MAKVTVQDIKALMELTGVGMMDCKRALVETDNDQEKAIVILREKGLATQAKKSGRAAAEGIVAAVVKGDSGVVVEVNTETDFAAQTDDFKAFVNAVAETILDNDPADVDALKALTLSGSDTTVNDALTELAGMKIRENIVIRRFIKMQGTLVSYVHGGGSIGVMVKLDTDLDADKVYSVGKDCALQIAAMNPAYLDRTQVPDEVLDKEKEILLAQMAEDPKMANKPEQVKVKIVEGKVGKYYSENCLLEQAFVKDDKVSVGKYVADSAKALGGEIAVSAFVRFERGEGVEKKEENFADEIASMIK